MQFIQTYLSWCVLRVRVLLVGSLLQFFLHVVWVPVSSLLDLEWVMSIDPLSSLLVHQLREVLHVMCQLLLLLWDDLDLVCDQALRGKELLQVSLQSVEGMLVHIVVSLDYMLDQVISGSLWRWLHVPVVCPLLLEMPWMFTSHGMLIIILVPESIEIKVVSPLVGSWLIWHVVWLQTHFLLQSDVLLRLSQWITILWLLGRSWMSVWIRDSYLDWLDSLLCNWLHMGDWLNGLAWSNCSWMCRCWCWVSRGWMCRSWSWSWMCYSLCRSLCR